MVKWRNPKIQTLPRQIVQIQDRLDELVMGGSSGFAFGGAGVPTTVGKRSENLVYNASLEDWDDVNTPQSWSSTSGNDWAVGTNVTKEETIVFAPPYCAKVGDGNSYQVGMAWAASIRVVPGQEYALGLQLLSATEGLEYALILRCFEADGETEITTGTPLGEGWEYSVAYGGWYLSAEADATDWELVEQAFIVSEDVHFLRFCIQLHDGGTEGSRYLYVDEAKFNRGTITYPFCLRPLFGTDFAETHKLLSDTHTDTVAASAVAGDVIYANADANWTRLPKGDNGEILKLVLGVPSWEAEGGGEAHALLSATHTDALPAVPVAGAIIYANGTPAWARLVKGADTYILKLVSGFPAWAVDVGATSVQGSGTAPYLPVWSAAKTLIDSNYYVQTFNSYNRLRDYYSKHYCALVASPDGYGGLPFPRYGMVAYFARETVNQVGSGTLRGYEDFTFDNGLLNVPEVKASTSVMVPSGGLYLGAVRWFNPTASGQLLVYIGGSVLGLTTGTNGYVLTMYGGFPAWRPATGGGISGTPNVIPRFLTSTTIGNSSIVQDLSGNTTITASFGTLIIKGRVINWTGGDFWLGYDGGTGRFIVGNGSGAERMTLDRTTGNLWIAGKLTEANPGCPEEWHKPNPPIAMFWDYVHGTIGKKQHTLGEELFALNRVVLDIDKRLRGLEKVSAS